MYTCVYIYIYREREIAMLFKPEKWIETPELRKCRKEPSRRRSAAILVASDSRVEVLNFASVESIDLI